jgi:isoquinoline 1-oxidoreductase beta subunit
MKINRRRFLLSSALVGGGVLIGYTATRPSRHRRANTELAGSGESFVTSLLKIEADNTVTIYVPHSEMGQGVHTSLSMMAADELDADWERVNIEQAPAIDLFANGDLVTGFSGELGAPSFLAPLISVSAVKIAELANLQTTGGSSSVRFTGEHSMRYAGAAARELLVQCAANRWAVPAAECTTALSHVQHNASGRSLSYGELAAEAAMLEPSSEPTLKTRDQYNIMGKAISRNDIPAKVDGSAPYGIDAQPDDMLYAAIRFAPVFGTKLVSVDAGDVLGRRGVKKIVQLEDSVAVVADSYWRAKEALKSVNAVFEELGNENISSATIYEQFDASLAGDESDKDREIGDTQAAFDSAADVIEASYRVPYLAHAAMEPMNCTVHLKDGRANIWTSTQDALGIKSRIASILGIAAEDATFHHSYVGGGFGRRLECDRPRSPHRERIRCAGEDCTKPRRRYAAGLLPPCRGLEL